MLANIASAFSDQLVSLSGTFAKWLKFKDLLFAIVLHLGPLLYWQIDQEIGMKDRYKIAKAIKGALFSAIRSAGESRIRLDEPSFTSSDWASKPFLIDL